MNPTIRIQNLSKIIYSLALLIFLLFQSTLSSAQTSIDQQKDSLRKFISETSGEEKLKAYNALAAIYMREIRNDNILDTVMNLYSQLEKEAIKEGNLAYQGLSMANIIVALNNHRSSDDEIIERAPSYMDFFITNKQWRNYYNCYSNLCEVHRRKNNYEKALQEADSMYKFAKEHNHASGVGLALKALASIYTSQRRRSDAELSLRESISVLKDSTIYRPIMLDSYSVLVTNLIAQRKYDDALDVLIENERAIKKYNEETKNPQTGLSINLWLNYTSLYRQTGQYDDAEKYLNKVDSISNGAIKSYEARAQILYGKKRYDEALKMIDLAIDDANNKLQPKGVKLMILIEMGASNEAYDLFNNVIVELDSTRNSQFNARLDEVRTQYEVDKHIAEKIRNRNYFLFVLGGCVLLIILLALSFRHIRVITKKNLSLYKQINEQLRSEREAEEAEMKIAPEQLSKEKRIYLELQQIMHTERLFVNPEVNRDQLSERLGTNRQYLSDAIKSETGLTFGQYIADLRLKYALELLTEQKELTLEAVAADSGHGSYSPFFKAFTNKYGMNPSEYRKFSADKRSHF